MLFKLNLFSEVSWWILLKKQNNFVFCFTIDIMSYWRKMDCMLLCGINNNRMKQQKKLQVLLIKKMTNKVSLTLVVCVMLLACWNVLFCYCEYAIVYFYFLLCCLIIFFNHMLAIVMIIIPPKEKKNISFDFKVFTECWSSCFTSTLHYNNKTKVIVLNHPIIYCDPIYLE